MKYIDSYRDPRIVHGLIEATADLAEQLDRPITIMEICGTHTHAIGRWGLRRLLHPHIRLISGPGCPVCVTSAEDISRVLSLAALPQVTLTSYGDMLRVPDATKRSLKDLRSEGADVRVVSSAFDVLLLAEAHPEREIVFLGIGFETTAPTVAATVKKARMKGIENFSVFSLHKTVPPVINALLDDEHLRIDGFLCPGHVSVITGVEAYTAIPKQGRAAVIAGFEPADIVEGILMILQQIREQRFAVEIQYARGVKPQGNARAREVMGEVFSPCDATWRGIGTIPASGLAIADPFAEFDAWSRFPLPDVHPREHPGCRCGDILKGLLLPSACPLFARSCTPLDPVGPCMVSEEGTCAAYYRYERPFEDKEEHA